MNITEYSTFRNIRQWPLGLLDDLFGYPDALPVLPPDFEGSLAYTLSLLEPIKRELILERYKERMTYIDIVSRRTFGSERARQIVARGMRELRHPSRLRFIKYGVAAVMIKEKETAAAKARERATEEAVRNYLFETAKEAEKGIIKDKAVLYKVRLENVNLSTRTYNCLRRACCETIGDVMAMTGDQLMRIRGLGLGSQNEIVTKLELMGFDTLHLRRPK